MEEQNKPVAWMLVDNNWNDFCRYSSYPSKGAIPLYTHPADESFDRTASHMAGEYVSHRSLAEEITEGFEALEKIRQLQVEIAELKNARDYWCLQYKDVFNKLEYQNDKYKQVLESIANEHVELSHDKIKWQCEDHIRWAKDVLK